MKILVIGNSYPPAPDSNIIASHFLRHMVLALKRAGAEVKVLTPDRDVPKKPDPGIDVHWFRWTGLRQTALIKLKLSEPMGLIHALTLFVGGMSAASHEARTFKPDLILAAFALPSGLFARHASKRSGIPYRVWCLGSDIHTFAKLPVFGWLTRLVLRDASVLYADGFDLGRQVEALAPGRKCEFLPTSIPSAGATANPIHFDPTKKHFLYVGRWELVKGLDVLLDAWTLLMKRSPETKAVLHIMGGGEGLRAQVEAAALNRENGGSIDVIGPLPREEVQRYYKATDYVVIPSRNESIPVVLSEAIQENKPLIVTAVGDMEQLVRDYALGTVVPSSNPDALATAMGNFVSHAPKFDSEKLSAALALFDIDRAANQILRGLR